MEIASSSVTDEKQLADARFFGKTGRVPTDWATIYRVCQHAERCFRTLASYRPESQQSLE